MKTRQSHVPDSELTNRLKNDDKDAFSIIYNRYWEKVYLLAYTILKNRDAAEDILQEVMISLWIRRHETEIEHLNAYLKQSVRFQVFNLIRREKKMPYSPISDVHESVSNSALSNFQLQDIQRSLFHVVEKLPIRCKEIFLLRRESELSIKEISVKLRISQKTVENQLTIALRRIRTHIEKYSGEVLTLCFILYNYLA